MGGVVFQARLYQLAHYIVRSPVRTHRTYLYALLAGFDLPCTALICPKLMLGIILSIYNEGGI
jgi:hypothetical protein